MGLGFAPNFRNAIMHHRGWGLSDLVGRDYVNTVGPAGISLLGRLLPSNSWSVGINLMLATDSPTVGPSSYGLNAL